MIGVPVYTISKKRPKTEEEPYFCCAPKAQADCQARKARRLSTLQDASGRVEEAELVIDNDHSDVEVENAGTVTI